MKTISLLRMLPLLLAPVLGPSLPRGVQAADQFVKVNNPGWTNSKQYSWSGAWGDYDKDGFIDLFVPNTTASWTGWTNFLYRNNHDGTFTSQSADVVGSIASDRQRSFGGYWGDVNNDGYIDLLASRLYLNQGDGSFHSIDAGDLSKPSSSSYYSGYWGGLADYDNDGWLDVFLVAADFSTGHNTNLLFHGRGDGTFHFVTNNVVATDRSSLCNDAAWGDYDNDGLPDLIVANWMYSDFFYHNDGHGQFTRMSNSIVQKYTGAHHAWGDYDNDGNLDLAAGNASGNTRLFRNNGMGDFVTATNLSAATAATPVWGDYDNDGFLDLLIICGQSTSAQLRLFRNNGDGTFSQAQDVFTRSAANWMGGGWGDYDNDGFLDLFATQTGGNNALYHNLGNANHWIKFRLEGVAANKTAIGAKVRVKATIDGKTVWQMREVSGGNYCQSDLRPNFGLGDATNVDLVRIEWPSGNVQELADVAPNQALTIREAVSITPPTPSVSLNGSVTLSRATAGTDASYQWQFNGADIAGATKRTLTLEGVQANQKGRYSVVVSNSGQIVDTDHVYLHVDTTFTKITTGPLVTDLGNSGGTTWGDFDGDGYPDVFVSRYRAGLSTLYQNNRDGTFSPTTTLPSQTTPDVWWAPAVAADFDNDGRLDLYAPRDLKTGFFYFNDVDGIFTAREFQERGQYWNVAVADVDRDGLLDLYLSTAGRLFGNNGDRTFTLTSALGGTPWGGATWVDYDDDGWLELFCAYSSGGNRLFHNDGTGRFVSVKNLLTLGMGLAEAWGDYDNDGCLDVCVAVFGGKSSVYRNLGNGEFELASIGQTIQGQYNSASWADYDNDGFLDLFMTYGNSGRNSLFRNNGDGTFTRIQTGSIVNDKPTGSGATLASYSGLWFDYDNDGFLDLYVSNGNDAGTAQTTNFLYHNNGNRNAWLKVKLIGTASNHDGVGAKVRAQAKYAGQIRWQRRDISAGDALNGNNLYAHFGLGDATNVTTLKIEWPSGAVRELTNIAPKQSLTIWEPPAIKAAVGANGACLLTITAEPNRTWRIEGSADLETWELLGKVTNSTATFTYTDPASATMVCRFYRTVRE